MKQFLQLYRSLVGRKIIAALTGLILLGFLMMHAFGNLNNFAGINADGIPAINAYADYLRNAATPLMPSSLLLWSIRLVLIVAFVMHVDAVVSLARLNRGARQTGYEKQSHQHTSFATRWVLASGLFLLVFIISHISNFAFGVLTPFDFIPGNVYHNLYSAFQYGWFVLFYLVALAVLGLHLQHGIWSLCQTLGLDNPDRNAALRMTANVIAIGLVIIFASIPLAFYVGLLPAIG